MFLVLLLLHFQGADQSLFSFINFRHQEYCQQMIRKPYILNQDHSLKHDIHQEINFHHHNVA